MKADTSSWRRGRAPASRWPISSRRRSYALRNKARVVVSTDTINLQEQLMGKDIPLLQRLLQGEQADERRCVSEGLRFAQLKGRRNYLCLLRSGGS